MDHISHLESEIRKAQTDKEIVVAVFSHVEKTMLWMEGLQIKLGLGGRFYNHVLEFLFGRTIQVRVGTQYSKVYQEENGTPQGSVCSPVLFNIMMNDIFEQVEKGIGKTVCECKSMQKKMQAAIEKVEQGEILTGTCWENSTNTHRTAPCR